LIAALGTLAALRLREGSLKLIAAAPRQERGLRGSAAVS
jgi:hypothetical protein